MNPKFKHVHTIQKRSKIQHFIAPSPTFEVQILFHPEGTIKKSLPLESSFLLSSIAALCLLFSVSMGVVINQLGTLHYNVVCTPLAGHLVK